MKELVQKIMSNAGISEDQAMKSLETIKDYVKEQFPMMAGAVDKLFESSAAPSANEEDYV